MIIEKLKIQDVDKLIDLYFKLVNRKTDINFAKERYLEILRDDNYYIIVAKYDDRVIGSLLAIVCKSIALDAKPFLVIEDVIVDENIRRMGVGRALFEEADRFAKEKECVYSILVSSGYRKEAHKFYENVGFDEDVVGFRKFYGF